MVGEEDVLDLALGAAVVLTPGLPVVVELGFPVLAEPGLADVVLAPGLPVVGLDVVDGDFEGPDAESLWGP